MGLHTDIPSRPQIERLLRARGSHLISIYLPATPITPEADAVRIAFKNLAAKAVTELQGAGAADRKAIEEELEGLHEDRDFWAEQAHSLAGSPEDTTGAELGEAPARSSTTSTPPSCASSPFDSNNAAQPAAPPWRSTTSGAPPLSAPSKPSSSTSTPSSADDRRGDRRGLTGRRRAARRLRRRRRALPAGHPR